jgi:hypothetical protein
MRARIKNIISLAAIGLLVGGATAQCLHATPTRAEIFRWNKIIQNSKIKI